MERIGGEEVDGCREDEERPAESSNIACPHVAHKVSTYRILRANQAHEDDAKDKRRDSDYDAQYKTEQDTCPLLRMHLARSLFESRRVEDRGLECRVKAFNCCEDFSDREPRRIRYISDVKDRLL